MPNENVYHRDDLRKAYDVVDEPLWSPVHKRLKDRGLVAAVIKAVNDHTEINVKNGESAAALLVALGPDGRRFVSDCPVVKKLRDFLRGAFPDCPAAPRPRRAARQPAGPPVPAPQDIPQPPQAPDPHPVRPAPHQHPDVSPADDADAVAEVAVAAAAAAVPKDGLASPASPRPSSPNPLPRAEGAGAGLVRRASGEHAAERDGELGNALARLLSKYMEDDKAKGAAGAGAPLPRLDDALVSRVMTATVPLGFDETHAALARPGVTRSAVDAYGQVADLVAVVKASTANVAGMERLGVMLVRALAEMGRVEATGLLPHLAAGAARYARAVAMAQAVYEDLCGQSSHTPEHLACSFVWPALPTSALPSQDYVVGFAQWGLSAVMALSPHREARTLCATVRHLLLPHWEAAVSAAQRWALPPAPLRAAPLRIRERGSEALASPPAKRPAGQRCATPGCAAQTTRPTHRLCDKCFRQPRARNPAPAEAKPRAASASGAAATAAAAAH